jgi:hypothetical protein
MGGGVPGVAVSLYVGRGVSGIGGEMSGFMCCFIRIVVVVTVPWVLCSMRTATIVVFPPVVVPSVVFPPVVVEDSNDADG